jgi:hypothetical protein
MNFGCCVVWHATKGKQLLVIGIHIGQDHVESQKEVSLPHNFCEVLGSHDQALKIGSILVRGGPHSQIMTMSPMYIKRDRSQVSKLTLNDIYVYMTLISTGTKHFETSPSS